tara:strand:- start:2837 stop:3922 length:1086 start_codon:yes stop_codon:yes gene_type:complete
MKSIFNSYKDKKVVITGHTGFKGSWLTAWLCHHGAHVYGISDSIPTNPSNFKNLDIKKNFYDHRINILDYKKLNNIIKKIAPDYIFHLAAESLVKKSYLDPLKAFNTNAIGSINLLESVRNIISNPPVVIMITSDKVYKNNEWIWGYRENDIIGGEDPYSASKGMAEIAINSYMKTYFKNLDDHKIAVARAGNVIGGGDWAPDRLIPDCMKAWSNGEEVIIRNPESTRPWQHVLEPLSGYLLLGLKLSNDNRINQQKFNFGPKPTNNFTVEEVINEMSKYWKNVKILKDTGDHDVKEAGLLKLNCDKALTELGWTPSLTFEETIKLTVEWYKAFYNNDNAYKLTINQINKFEKIIKNKFQN